AYTMSMMPVIDSLGTRIDSAVLRNATVDMASHTIGGESLEVKLADACYIYPDSASAAAVMPPAGSVPADTAARETPDSAMWTIRASHLRLDGGCATYAMRGAIPRAGLDMNYLQASGISIEVDSFFNRGTAITIPLRHLEARERCGVALKANGLFSMDSTAMYASRFNISTDYSQLHLDATMGMGNLADSPSLPLRLLADAAISLEDIETALPTLKPMMRGIPRGAPLRLNADISGTSGNLRISELNAGIARFFTFNADGVVKNPFDFKRMDGRVSFHADAIALNRVKPTLLEARLASQLNIPVTIIDGHVDYSPNLISGKLRAVAAGGHLALDGSWRQRAESYDASFRADNFHVDAFMPSLGVGAVTATVKASGKGYNPTASSTAMNLTVDIDNAVYLGENYRSILVDATLADNSARGRLTSANPAADIDMTFDAT
ncbi:MAG: hypothetical protein K2F71_07250, partial [Paramuribaculum sp.]|nr:hypothetical protein [Paramuribaculum sp.]